VRDVPAHLGPNLAKGQILANEALGRVFQWQTFVHVQCEGPIRVHVQPLQRRQSAQVSGRQPPLPRGLCEHLLDHQGVDVYQADLEQVEREHGHLLILPLIARELATLAIQDEIVGAVPVFHDVGSCTCALRINTPGSSVDLHRAKKA
jgi:hypothetical protein